MKGIIFLSGGGGADDSRLTDIAFVESLPVKSKILYVPHANIKQSNDYSASVAWLSGLLDKIRGNKSIKVDLAGDISSISSIDSYDAVYIGGGNTYYLLDHLRKTGFFDVLIRYYIGGGIVYGGSAGAIVLGKSIETAPDDRSLAGEICSYDGMNLIGGMSIVCHYEKGIQSVFSGLENEAVLCLYENSGVKIEGRKIINVGSRHYDLEIASSY